MKADPDPTQTALILRQLARRAVNAREVSRIFKDASIAADADARLAIATVRGRDRRTRK